jgi:hypothetical protein
MIIALSEECPLFAPASEIELHRFLQTIAMRWHAIIRPDPDRLKQILPPHVWRVYGELIRREYRTSASVSRSWTLHRDCGACDAGKLATFYSLPTMVVVENGTTDGGWMSLIASHLRPSLLRLLNGKNSIVTIAHAGGIGEIPKELRRLSAPYLKARPGNDIPLRVVALCDSDAKLPGNPSLGAVEVSRVAAEIGASSHVLKKRTIENYVPDESLLAYANARRDRVDAALQIVSLSGAARDHYPIKYGLTEADALELYPSGVELRLGLGDFMQDFLSNHYHSVSRHELKARDGEGELDEFLSTLERNL